MTMKVPEGKHISTVRVGEKGQIVIPKAARDLFGIKPGDTLVLLADVDRGIALAKYEAIGEWFQEVLRAEKSQEEEK